MRILSIETSCDETSAAVIEKKEFEAPIVLASKVASSSNLHALTGGIVPEAAAREQLKYINPIILQTLFASEQIAFPDLKSAYIEGSEMIEKKIDAIAVTQGPGLIGSLLVGVETAKTLALIYNKPIIPVNHLIAHVYANFISTIDSATPSFPFIGLIVSGGHTDLLLFQDHGQYEWIGGTRDDAAGEALDKIGRVLGLPYPAGPEIEKRAILSTDHSIKFSRPLLHSDDYDFSFSGLKTEAARYIDKQKEMSDELKNNICYAVQDAATDVLVLKTLKAANNYGCNSVVIGGGVSANQNLREKFLGKSERNTHLSFPEKKYTTDNAAMVGAYAAFNYHPVEWDAIKATPGLSLV